MNKRWRIKQVRCPTCGSERNETEPRCLNVVCPLHRQEEYHAVQIPEGYAVTEGGLIVRPPESEPNG